MKAPRFLFGLVLAMGMAPMSALAQTADSPIVQARKALTEAQNAVTVAKANLDRARVRIAAAFKTQNPDYAKAEADAAKARVEIETTKAAALTAVRSKPQYLAAVNAKAAAQTKMRALQEAGNVGDAEFNKLAEESIRHSTTINTMERTAVDTDPKYADAVNRLTEANQVVDSFKSQLDEACAADPDYMALMMAHEQAVQAVAQAQDGMKQAADQLRQQQIEAARSRAAERSSKSKSK